MIGKITPDKVLISFSTSCFIFSSFTSPVSKTLRLKLTTETRPKSVTTFSIRPEPLSTIDASSACAPKLRRSVAAKVLITAPPTITATHPCKLNTSVVAIASKTIGLPSTIENFIRDPLQKVRHQYHHKDNV